MIPLTLKQKIMKLLKYIGICALFVTTRNDIQQNLADNKKKMFIPKSYHFKNVKAVIITNRNKTFIYISTSKDCDGNLSVHFTCSEISQYCYEIKLNPYPYDDLTLELLSFDDESLFSGLSENFTSPCDIWQKINGQNEQQIVVPNNTYPLNCTLNGKILCETMVPQSVNVTKVKYFVQKSLTCEILLDKDCDLQSIFPCQCTRMSAFYVIKLHLSTIDLISEKLYSSDTEIASRFLYVYVEKYQSHSDNKCILPCLLGFLGSLVLFCIVLLLWFKCYKKFKFTCPITSENNQYVLPAQEQKLLTINTDNKDENPQVEEAGSKQEIASSEELGLKSSNFNAVCPDHPYSNYDFSKKSKKSKGPAVMTSL